MPTAAAGLARRANECHGKQGFAFDGSVCQAEVLAYPPEVAAVCWLPFVPFFWRLWPEHVCVCFLPLGVCLPTSRSSYSRADRAFGNLSLLPHCIFICLLLFTYQLYLFSVQNMNPKVTTGEIRLPSKFAST